LSWRFAAAATVGATLPYAAYEAVWVINI